MGLFDRIVLALYSMAVSVVAGVLFLVSVGWTRPLTAFAGLFGVSSGRLTVAVVALVFVGVSARMLLLMLRRAPARVGAIVHDSPLGEVRVSLSAIENLVGRTARQVQGVREVKSRVSAGSTGVAVSIRAWVSPDISIPAATDEIQNRVKDYIANVVGVGVEEVRVLIENITSERKSRVE